MIYNRKSLEAAFQKGEKFKFLFFWGHQPHPSGQITQSCFSQWWLSDFTVDGTTYHSAEHWMMAEKARLFQDQEMLEKIIEAPTPAEAKKLGRAVRSFDQATWESKRFDIVVEGNRHKFSQQPEIMGFLLGTQNLVLVEASPRDRIWGIGMGGKNENASNPTLWRGQNLLGFALMKARDHFLELN